LRSRSSGQKESASGERSRLPHTLSRAVALSQTRAITRLELDRQEVSVAIRLAFWSTTADENTEATLDLEVRLQEQAVSSG